MAETFTETVASQIMVTNHSVLETGVDLAKVAIESSTFGILAALQETQALQEERLATGVLYLNESRPAPGYQDVFSTQDEQDTREIFRKIGLSNLADLIRFEIYKETREKLKYVYSPIKSNIIRMTLRLIKETIDRLSAQDPRRIELEYIIAHINSAASDDLNYYMPRIKVTDLAKTGLQDRFVRVLRDLNPSRTHEVVTHELQRNGYSWEQLYQEIVDVNSRNNIQQALDAGATLTIPNAPEETFDQAVRYIQHGAAHEVAHFLVAYFTPEMEAVLYKAFMGLKTSPLYHKNMTRALLAVQQYRQQNNIAAPTRETNQLILFMFLNEMCCDYLAIYFMEKAGQRHMYSDYGVSISEEVRQVFDPCFAKLQEMDQRKEILLFSDQELANSKMTKVQRLRF